MPSYTDLKKAFAKKYSTLTPTQKDKHVFNSTEQSKPLSWNDIHQLISDENQDCLEALQALYRAQIIK